MFFIIIMLLHINPFYEGEFSSLNARSISIFSNPAGLGIQPGAELFFTYNPEPKTWTGGTELSNIGLGIKKIDSLTYYEIGAGYKLPGAFAFGYCYQFGDTSSHKFGLLCRPSRSLSIGFNTTLGSKKAMHWGIGIRPFKEYFTLCFDLKYEGIEDTLRYFYGGILEPIPGLKLQFLADKDFHWHAGIELSFGKTKAAGSYEHENKKLSGGMIFSAQRYPTAIPGNEKIIEVSLKGSYPEIARKSFLGIPLSVEPKFTKFMSDLASLDNRDDIKVILIRLQKVKIGPAQLEELRGLLNRLKKKKKIVFFSDRYNSTLLYELASCADEVILSPLGSVTIPGLAMRKLYLKGTLEKLGIETDIVHIGKYKSAIEIFTRENMSEADRAQIERYLDDIYPDILQNIARARNKKTEQVQKIIDSLAYLNSDAAKSLNIIDTTIYDFELDDYIKKRYGAMAKVNFEDFLEQKDIEPAWLKNLSRIALVIAEGAIVTGKGNPGILQSNLIGGETYAEIFDKLSRDKKIKGVLLRINSGGGDAFASDKIAYALKKCAGEKPVVVSMGDVAGSGGYYIACLADKIYADGRTITGSIGVLNLRLINKGFYDKIGIKWDYIKRGEHADIFWDLRHLTDAEIKREEDEVRWWYNKFLDRVSEGRGINKAKADSLGQGRIYSGKYARRLGLVDKNGGFLDALNTLKKLAGIKGDVEVITYPQSTRFTILNNRNTKGNYLFLMPEYELH